MFAALLITAIVGIIVWLVFFKFRWIRFTPYKVLEKVEGTGGKIIKTSLSHDDEAKLEAALSAVKQ